LWSPTSAATIPDRSPPPCASCSWRPAAGRSACSPQCVGCAPFTNGWRPALAEAGLALHAQHVDPLDPGTLTDIFRAEEDSCLLGTDAVRDGMDVPGRALRLLCFDRVPWPRPDILHKARRMRFGQRTYDDALARARIAQAFGRLIRRADDRGVFVLLDSAAPTRLFSGLPEGVPLERVGLVEAIEATAEFLGTAPGGRAPFGQPGGAQALDPTALHSP
jgi:hypothetical protein